jgi:hypothetical protein
MRWRRLQWASAGVLGCALALPAEGKVTKGSEEERADAELSKATTALREGRREEAVERYRAAWEIFKDPSVMCELGGLEIEMGRARDAAEHLSTCLRLLKPEYKQILRAKIESGLKKARAQVGTLKVEANVPDAEVVVNGKTLGTLPREEPIFVDPGTYGVEVQAAGYQSDVRVAVLTAGSSLFIRMRLEPMRTEVARPLHEPAPLEPKTEANSPIPPRSPAPAPKGPVPLPKPAEVADTERTPVRAAVILTGLGLSVAGTAVGMGGIMAGAAAREQAKEMIHPIDGSSPKCAGDVNNPCAEVYNKMNTAVVGTAVGVAGFTVSAIGGALIVYELIRSAPNGKPASTQVAVVGSPSGGALKITGSF